MKSRKELRASRERREIRRRRLLRSEVELFAAGIAHEFNNVLGAALGHAEWALDSGKSPDMKEALEIIVKACERAREITWALKGLAQPREERFARLDVTALVKDFADWATNFLQDSPIKFISTIEPELAIDGDRDQIHEILLNLVKNARDSLVASATPSPSIRLQAAQVAGEVCFSVCDNGAGVPAEFRESIFQPFFTTKGVLGHLAPGGTGLPSAGMGLGLYMARNAAIEHGGDSTLGAKPAEFLLKIPSA